MGRTSVLISGAGVAGPTVAYWLARRGLRPTLLERAAELRSSGSPVDVRGPAVAVAEGMGVMPRVRAAGTGVAAMRFVDRRGRGVGRVNGDALRRATGSREVELPRGDLARILYEAGAAESEIIFGDSIATLAQDPGGVDVTFERAAPRRFDFVVGADGLHSNVRRLAFGPEADFVRHQGMYVATMPYAGPREPRRDMVMYNAPGRAVAVHPGRDRALVAFMFRSPALPGFDYRDTDAHRRLLADAFARDGWIVPDLLARLDSVDDLYFDSVSKVTLPRWSSGRVVLLGDAGSCVSLFGDGSTLAMVGAHTLAEELGAEPGDHVAAFRRYEERHRRLVDPRQRGVARGASLVVPATRAGIAARNAVTRLWPVLAVAGRVRRALRSA